MIRAVLVDDEQPARERLKQLLAAHADVEVVGEAEDGVQAAELIADRQPDVVFLDIQMPGASGMDVAASLGRSWCSAPHSISTPWTPSSCRPPTIC